MTFIFELFDGSHDWFMLSVYIGLLASVALRTVWTCMMEDTSFITSADTVQFETTRAALNLVTRPIQSIIIVYWITRTVKLKDSPDDDDHLLLIR
ncbi:hypothetical protein [Thalassobacillus hwangdonensis]|uniref:Uncharacterized protein n=1 Tax=Thalassobacillus hwangdonensis TaxID=546108 RepID=A0ABW3KUR1_9BACI